MPVRSIPLERHRTVVSVLREAAQRNGDVEAYVEPGGRGGTGAGLTFGQWDRAADGVAGPAGRARVSQGRRGLPAPSLLHRLRRALRRPAPSGGHHLGHQPRMGAQARWPPS
jgi:hypothetical protein